MTRHILVNNFLEFSARNYPDKVALICEDERITYAEINSMANKLAGRLLEEGVEKGDRVAIFMENSIEAVVSIFGALKSGAAVVIMNNTTKTKMLSHLLNHSRARVLLSQGNKTRSMEGLKCPHLQTVIISNPLDRESSHMTYENTMKSGRGNEVISPCIDIDLAAVIYTSGSTGNQKGVMLSHRNMVSAAHSISSYIGTNKSDIIINVLPLSFDYGLYQVLMGFSAGATVILEKSFTYPYKVVETMIRERVTGFPGIPTIFAILLQMKNIDKYDFSSLRYITSTAAALPLSQIERLRKLFPNAKLYSMYGLTECKRVSFLSPDDIDRKPTSVGRGMPNQEVYIVNENGDRVGPGEIGELVVRGSNVMMGYWEMPEETEKCLKPGRYPGERVLFTGDLFRMDEEGYLYFISRKDDIIKCQGEKVSPKEVENVLYSLEGIREAVVTGVADNILGQAIKAHVVTDAGSGLTEEKILTYCSMNLENPKVPRYVEIRSSLPRTSTGKINKSGLETRQMHSYLSEMALKVPDKVAVIQEENEITYSKLDQHALKVASFLVMKGMQKGDRIAILGENSPEYISVYFGVQKAGGISVDINPQYSPHEAGKVLGDCGARMLIVESRYIRLVLAALRIGASFQSLVIINSEKVSQEIKKDLSSHVDCYEYSALVDTEFDEIIFPDITGTDIASIIYTSGTTGEPKGVMLSHDNFISNAESISEYLHINRDDRIMVILPFYYSYGKSLLNTHIMAGGSMVLENSFMYPNVVLNKMVEREVTGFAGVPSTFAILLNRSSIRKYSFPKLRYVTQAGGPMSPHHAGELSGILKDKEIYIMYGQTEATARLTYLPPKDFFRKRGSIGKAIPGVEIELLKENGEPAETGQEGEIVAEGKNIMLGYWNRPEETMKVLKAGRLHTGDIASMDEEGYLYIVGRRSDMIKSGAHRISPKEIEEVIIEMPEVHEAAVVGIEDEILGEAIRAVIVLKDGFDIKAKEVRKHCQKKLALFKIPKEIVFVDELPKTSSGKVRRHLCKELAI